MQKLPLSRTRFGEDIVAEFLPPEKQSKKVIIFSAGCPGYPLGKEALMRHYASLGYWTICYAYRGTWESGGSFLEHSPAEDVRIIMDNLHRFDDLWSEGAYSLSDPEIYLIGGSFGGAATLLASRDSRVKKAATISGVVDWRQQEYTAEPLDVMNEFIPRAFGMGYRGEQAVYRKLSVGDFYNPAYEADSIDGSKLLLIHAKDDRVVHSAPAEAFAKQVGATCVLLAHGDHRGVGSASEPEIAKYIEKFFKT